MPTIFNYYISIIACTLYGMFRIVCAHMSVRPYVGARACAYILIIVFMYACECACV